MYRSINCIAAMQHEIDAVLDVIRLFRRLSSQNYFVSDFICQLFGMFFEAGTE